MTFQIDGRSAALVLAFIAGLHVGMPALAQARPVEKFEPAESLEGNYLAAVVAGSARDLGAALGVGGHLTALRRTRVGAFTLEDAATLETIAEQAGDGGVPRVIPMAQAAADSFVVHDLDVEEERALGYGQRIASAHRGEETVAAIAPDGRLAAILDERAATAKSRVTFPA